MGIGAGVAALGTAIGSGLTAAGVGAATAATIGSFAAPALVGAGIGAVGSGITGGDPGEGALFGGLTGGAVGGLGGALGGSLGIGETAGDALAGAGAGAVASGINGTDPLSGTLQGGLGGAVTGLISPSGATAGSTAAPASGANASSLAGAAPTSGADLTPGATDLGAAQAVSGVGADISGGTSGAAAAAAPAGNFSVLGGTSPGALTTSNLDLGSQLDMGINAATPASGSGGFLSNLGAQLTKNPSALLAAAPLAMNVLSPSSLQGQGALSGQAAQLSAQGQQLQNYLNTGQLPPGVQQATQLAQKNAEAAIRSKYASMGQSGSTAETQDLANVQQQAAAQAYQQALGLFQSGLQEQGISSEIYSTLMNADANQQKATGQAISNFAAALAGTTPKQGA